MSMAALLAQLSQADPSPAGADSLNGCLIQLQETGGVFSGVSLHAIPASLVVANYIAETGDRAQQCLSAAAGDAQEQDGNKAAECSAVLCAVEGLLQLSVQPVVRQLFGLQPQQELIGGLLSCKQQLIDTFARLS
jgi:hypothetical protein